VDCNFVNCSLACSSASVAALTLETAWAKALSCISVRRLRVLAGVIRARSVFHPCLILQLKVPRGMPYHSAQATHGRVSPWKDSIRVLRRLRACSLAVAH